MIIFLQPLKDIAAVAGQSARFECIVQCEPLPNSVFWTKNGQVIENSQKYQIEFRNGVCRLTIPQSFPGERIIFQSSLKMILNTFRWCWNLWMRRSKPHRSWCNACRANGPRRQARIQNLLIILTKNYILTSQKS